MTSATAKSSEPTIDDILASIRRIIADDQQAVDEPVPAQRIVAEGGDDVLDLAQPLTRPASAPTAEPKAAPVAALSQHDVVVAAVRPKANEPVLPPKPSAAAKPFAEAKPDVGLTAKPVAAAPQPASGPKLERLIAGEAEDALAAAFGRISALKVTAETKTLEGLMVDLLRPMLKEWLDANLPAIAERLVKQEIERIAAQSGR